ncbi:hypothetical protein HUW30_11810 [Bacillus velezensis]|nr:hypothetical protein [Bacillus velezensis]NVE04211.1 hypothetical protein [Bacillus velezensis]WFO89316.1 hypothetical protein JEQ16_12355 [Bacillus velezensis]GJJ26556.1 hypothetical protein BVN1_23200 [Bacillus velezensis]
MAKKYIQAHKDYLKGMKYKDLAEKYGVSVNTIKSWKQLTHLKTTSNKKSHTDATSINF